jgi:hypothetical protein
VIRQLGTHERDNGTEVTSVEVTTPGENARFYYEIRCGVCTDHHIETTCRIDIEAGFLGQVTSLTEAIEIADTHECPIEDEAS